MAEIFQVTTGGDQSNSLNSGNFFYISGPPQRDNINSLQKKTFNKSLGGHGPPGPAGYATGWAAAFFSVMSWTQDVRAPRFD